MRLPAAEQDQLEPLFTFVHLEFIHLKAGNFHPLIYEWNGIEDMQLDILFFIVYVT